MPDEHVLETDGVSSGEGIVLTSPAESGDAAETSPATHLIDPSTWGAGEEPPLGEPSSLLDLKPLLALIEGLKENLDRRLDSIQTSLDREARAEATRERVIDRLHAELQEYKQDLLLKVQRPIFIDLIQLHDDVGKMIEAADDDDSEFARAQQGRLESIQTALEDVLYRQGVEPFTVEGQVFDARRQRAIKTVPVDDPALNKTVSARIRKGFQAGDKLIRPELVSVRTFRPGAAPDRSD